MWPQHLPGNAAFDLRIARSAVENGKAFCVIATRDKNAVGNGAIHDGDAATDAIAFLSDAGYCGAADSVGIGNRGDLAVETAVQVGGGCAIGCTLVRLHHHFIVSDLLDLVSNRGGAGIFHAFVPVGHVLAHIHGERAAGDGRKIGHIELLCVRGKSDLSKRAVAIDSSMFCAMLLNGLKNRDAEDIIPLET